MTLFFLLVPRNGSWSLFFMTGSPTRSGDGVVQVLCAIAVLFCWWKEDVVPPDSRCHNGEESPSSSMWSSCPRRDWHDDDDDDGVGEFSLPEYRLLLVAFSRLPPPEMSRKVCRLSGTGIAAVVLLPRRRYNRVWPSTRGETLGLFGTRPFGTSPLHLCYARPPTLQLLLVIVHLCSSGNSSTSGYYSKQTSTIRKFSL